MSQNQWYYLDAEQQQQGPVSKEQLDRMVIAGKITSETLVWHEGMDGWKSLFDASPIQVADINASPAMTHFLDYGGFWRRFAAYFIDSLILGLILVPLYFGGIFLVVMTAQKGNNNPDGLAAMFMVFVCFYQIVALVVTWLYFARMESSERQATYGKSLLGLLVTDLDGQRLSFGRATGRFFSKIVSGIPCYIGFIMAGFTERKQALHDMIVGSLVVRK